MGPMTKKIPWILARVALSCMAQIERGKSGGSMVQRGEQIRLVGERNR